MILRRMTRDLCIAGQFQVIGASSTDVAAKKPVYKPELYKAYYRPTGYDFEDVERSIALSRSLGLYTMVNYLIFPGVSDREEELEALVSLVHRTGLNFLHLKNLNIDPQLYLREMPAALSKLLGMRQMVELLRKACPDLQVGYFNQAIR